MNKIIRDNNKFILDDKLSYLEITKNASYEINVLKDKHQKLEIIGTDDYAIKINLEENSSLEVNSLNKDNSVKIDLFLKKGAKITYNHSVISQKDSDNYFNIHHLEDGSISLLNNNGINLENKKLFFTINGVIDKHLKDINCSQNSKILNYSNGNSKIIPNLIIDSNDIVANHSAYIGYINPEEVFYMESRGISKENIRNLIYKATMIGKMKLSNKEKFNQILNEWW